MEKTSPLDAIKQAEIEVVRRVAEARAAAEQSLIDTKSQVENLLNQLRTEGEQAGQALHDDLLAKTEAEANRLLADAEERAVALRAQGETLREEAVTLAVNMVLGRD